jgi:hypothetical protein
MHSLLIAAAVFVCLLAAAWLGMKARGRLPRHHLTAESQDAVKIGMALIATMSALVLGLLIASAKSSFDAQNAEVRQMAGNLAMMDRLLGEYGPEAKDARALLRDTVEGILKTRWRQGDARSTVFEDPAVTAVALEIFAKVDALTPKDSLQSAIKEQVVDLIKITSRTRWQLVAEEGSAIPMPFLVVLVFWLSVLFASFGLFAPRNATVITAFVVCAMSVAGAVFLILELDQPFEGLMQISSEPFREVLEQ